MCYYNRAKISKAEKILLKETAVQLEFPIDIPIRNGFEYSQWPVLKPVKEECGIKLVMMEWGFIPFYLKDRESVNKFRLGYKDDNGKFHTPVTTLNAVGEELLFPNKMYREAALKRRCLVISSGFFEWRHTHPLGKTGKPLKTALKSPYHISITDREYFFMAGVWQPWTDKETGETVETFALVTTAANPLMAQIHNSKMRMPTILTEDLAAEWISDNLTETRITEIATFQYSATEMKAHTIAKDFRTASDPTEKYNYPDLPEITL